MNLVFIHGRGQGQNTEANIRASWTAGLCTGLSMIGVAPGSGYATLAPFYGAELDRLTTELARAAVRVIERGDQAATAQPDPLTVAIVARMAERAGIDPAQTPDGQVVVERGLENWESVQWLTRKLIGVAPWLAEFSIGRFTADVRAYLDRPHIRKAVHDIVAPAITAGPCVVVAHSLGTIVAYRLLVELAAAPSVKLLITAGSPLGIATIKDKLPPRGQVLRFPPGVEHWLNVADQQDYVALEASLDRKTFLDGVENILDIDNGDEPHSIERYLADITVARRIARALGLV